MSFHFPNKMVAKSPTKASMWFIVACVAMLVSTAPAQFAPQPGVFPFPRIIPGQPGEEIQQCWSSLQNVQGCTNQVEGSLINGQFGLIGPACCEAINKIIDNCWAIMFPFSPLFPPLLKKACATGFGGVAPTPTAIESTKMLLPEPKDVSLCWSSLEKVQGCVSEIVASLFGGQISGIGPACCKAITEILNDNCWPNMFPLNPAFPPLLKSYCTALSPTVPK